MKENNNMKNENCKDKLCPIHGQLSVRGRYFQGSVMKKFPKRVVIEFERMVKIQKYERYLKTKTKLHARLPECMQDINVGDYIEVGECRPLSKIIHFVVVKKILKDFDQKSNENKKISDIKKIVKEEAEEKKLKELMFI